MRCSGLAYSDDDRCCFASSSRFWPWWMGCCGALGSCCRVRAMKTLAMVLGVMALSTSAAVAQGDVEQLAEAAAHANAGRHAQAITIYEQLYARSGDQELLPV